MDVISTLSSYRLISSRMDQWVQTTRSTPTVARDTKHYLERIESVRSIDDFIKDDRVFAYAMKAFGLADMAYAKAFMRKVLQEGVDAPGSIANRLADGRYREFVETFNFRRYGETTTIFDRTRQGTVDRYVRQTLEENAGQQNESVRLALYFQRKAKDIDGPFDILADRALTSVAFAALGLPATTSLAAIDTQARLLESRMDFAALKSEEGVARFISRFAALSDAQSGRAAGSATTLLPGRSQGGAMGIDMLMAVQAIRLRATI